MVKLIFFNFSVRNIFHPETWLFQSIFLTPILHIQFYTPIIDTPQFICQFKILLPPTVHFYIVFNLYSSHNRTISLYSTFQNFPPHTLQFSLLLHFFRVFFRWIFFSPVEALFNPHQCHLLLVRHAKIVAYALVHASNATVCSSSSYSGLSFELLLHLILVIWSRPLFSPISAFESPHHCPFQLYQNLLLFLFFNQQNTGITHTSSCLFPVSSFKLSFF
jgi:hypothetical protein